MDAGLLPSPRVAVSLSGLPDSSRGLEVRRHDGFVKYHDLAYSSVLLHQHCVRGSALDSLLGYPRAFRPLDTESPRLVLLKDSTG